MSTPQPQQPNPTLAATDPTLTPFLAPTFSPTAYLNSVLPTWPSSQAATAPQAATPLSQLTTDTQELLTRLTTQLTRLSTVLTSLTDEILRSGSRLAYEVEVLRGDTTTLHDVLHADSTSSLKAQFARLGVTVPPASASTSIDIENTAQQTNGLHARSEDAPLEAAPGEHSHVHHPEYIRTLRTLTTVRANLDRVVTVFGAAIDWVLAPSEVAARGAGSAVSAVTEGKEDLEARGREVAARLKDEIEVLVEGGVGGGLEGVESAERRVGELRELVGVWKGTVEERARARFVESLGRVVEDVREKKRG